MSWSVVHGHCIEAMREMDAASVHAVVTDPPYGLSKEPDITEVLTHWLAGDDYKHHGGGFMGSSWDSFVPGPAYWREVHRVLRPGGHLLAFGGTRTVDLLSIALRMASFEIRDCILWLYGSGFPKSLDVSKAIDKAAGAEREIIGSSRRHSGGVNDKYAQDAWTRQNAATMGMHITAPATDYAKRWEGWGSALKPAYEPIVVARKPLVGTLSQNVLASGTGALNIDGCRIGSELMEAGRVGHSRADGRWEGGDFAPTDFGKARVGRWPANVVLSHSGACGEEGCIEDCPVRLLDKQTGVLPGGTPRKDEHGKTGTGATFVAGHGHPRFGEQGGGASRFFYCAKTSSTERNAGLEDFEAITRDGQSTWAGLCNVCDCRMMLNGKPTCGHNDFEWVIGKPTQNPHPTVKPISLMRWLVRLVTPSNGTVLDPFAGSGTTGCAAVLEDVNAIMIERESEYVDICRARVAWWERHPQGMDLNKRLELERQQTSAVEVGQGALFDF